MEDDGALIEDDTAALSKLQRKVFWHGRCCCSYGRLYSLFGENS